MFVLGIDPGLSRCGYGCIEHARTPRAVAAGVIRTDPAHQRAERLCELQRELRDLIAELRPDVVAVERVFFQHNASTAMGVAMASGLAIAEAASAGCEVVEYSPNEIKQAVAGSGAAGKDEMSTMVQTLLRLPERLSPVDAADAVAVALCHAARLPVGARPAGRQPVGARPASRPTADARPAARPPAARQPADSLGAARVSSSAEAPPSPTPQRRAAG